MQSYYCKICENKLDKNVFYTDFNNITYSKCKKCDLVYQTKIHEMTESEIFKMYDDSYLKKRKENVDENDNNRLLQYKVDKKLIEGFFSENVSHKILDYGCGQGDFLSLFNSKKFGYEINKFSSKKFDDITYLDQNQIEHHKYDLIMMRGVIEHLKDFDKVLIKLFQNLKIDGYFFITATPNSSSLSFFLNNKQFNQNTKEHLYHFNHINLAMFFLKNNLYNINTQFLYHETPYKNFEKDYLRNKKLLKNSNEISPPSVGNMLSMVFKKME